MKMDTFLKSSDDFLNYEQGENIKSSHDNLINKLSLQRLKKLKRASCYRELTIVCESLSAKRDSYMQEIKEDNSRVAKRRLEDDYKLVDYSQCFR
jgi:hypothetical protein